MAARRMQVDQDASKRQMWDIMPNDDSGGNKNNNNNNNNNNSDKASPHEKFGRRLTGHGGGNSGNSSRHGRDRSRNGRGDSRPNGNNNTNSNSNSPLDSVDAIPITGDNHPTPVKKNVLLGRFAVTPSNQDTSQQTTPVSSTTRPRSTPGDTPASPAPRPKPIEKAEKKHCNWVFTAEDLAKTPSVVKNGMKLAEEEYFRYNAIRIMFRMTRDLNLNYQCLYSAAVFLHRFYVRNSFKEHPFQEAILGALFLANKTEEVHHKAATFAKLAVCQFQNVKLKDAEQHADYGRWVKKTLLYEQKVLFANCFEMSITQVYPTFETYRRKLGVPDDACRDAWYFLSDCLRTTVVLMYPGEIIQAAAFYYSRRVNQVEYDNSSRELPFWQTVYHTDEETLIELCNTMIEKLQPLVKLKPDPSLKRSYPAKLEGPLYTGDVKRKGDDLEKDESDSKRQKTDDEVGDGNGTHASNTEHEEQD